MRSIQVGRPGAAKACPSVELAKRLAEASDSFLIDTWTENEPVAGFVGITGQTCDRETARAVVEASPIPVILAGGLGPDNVAQAIREVRPAGVDSCSKTNAVGADGRPIRFTKDLAKVAAFVREARSAATDLG